MLFSRLRQTPSLISSSLRSTQKMPSTSDLSPSTTRGPAKSSTTTTQSPTNTASLSPRPDPETSETTSTSRPTSTTGSTKTESTTSTKPTFEEPKSTCSAQSSTPDSQTWVVSTLSPSSAGSTGGLATTEIPISKSIFPKFLQDRSSKLSGTALPFSSEDWPLQRWTRRRTNSPSRPSSTRPARSASTLQEILRSWSARQSAPTWAASPFPTSEPTTVGSASATALSMTSWAACVRVPHFWTCHTSTTLCTKTALSSASRKWSSQSSLPLASGPDSIKIYPLCYNSHNNITNSTIVSPIAQ